MAEMNERKTVLIGAMGSGKSTLAALYAARHGKTVLDTDAEFTRRHGEISAYFKGFGEQAFRKVEEEILIDAAKSDCDVIACGGGAVTSKCGMSALRSVGDVVLLTAPSDVLSARISATDRPLKADADRLIKERETLYLRYADYTVSTEGSDIGVAVRGLETALTAPRGNRYDVLLCDADDTVLDYQAAMRHSLTTSARAVGISCPDDRLIATYKSVSDDIWGRLEKGEIDHAELNDLRFKLLRDGLNEDFDIESMNDAYFTEMKKTRFLVDGAREFLRQVRSRGIKVYIATNAFESIACERLKALDGYIDGAFVSETVGYDKPDVRYFERVFAAIGMPSKERTLMFGDGLTSDIAGGKAFGIDTCLFDRSGCKRSDAEYSVRSYAELLKII